MSNIVVQPSNVGRGASNTLPYFPTIGWDIAQSQFYQTAYPLQFPLITGAIAAETVTYEMTISGRNLNAIAVYSTSGTYNATVLVEGTLDGIGWVTLESITSPQITQLSGLYQSIRVSIPAYASGTINVAGMSQRG
jgi:hypothetical protein